MVQAWRNGAEVVTAVRDDRDAEGLVKVATASWFYRVFNRLVDSIQLQEGAGDFRLLSAPVVDHPVAPPVSPKVMLDRLPQRGDRLQPGGPRRRQLGLPQALALCPGWHLFVHGEAAEGSVR